MSKPLLVNLRQVSAVRQPTQGSIGARLACLTGSTVPVEQPFDTVVKLLREGPGTEPGLWLSLANEYGKPVAVNFERVRAVRPGPGSFGGSMLVFLPDFTLYVQESPEEIGKLLGESPNTEAAGYWIKLTSENEKWVLVNSARIALVRQSPRGGPGSFLTFLAGGQLMVQESPEEVLNARGSGLPPRLG
jgi:uncharacterized protein YlzI (FlbEa/FlbD family)